MRKILAVKFLQLVKVRFADIHSLYLLGFTRSYSDFYEKTSCVVTIDIQDSHILMLWEKDLFSAGYEI